MKFEFFGRMDNHQLCSILGNTEIENPVRWKLVSARIANADIAAEISEKQHIIRRFPIYCGTKSILPVKIFKLIEFSETSKRTK